MLTLINELSHFQYPIRHLGNRTSWTNLKVMTYGNKTVVICSDPESKSEMSITNSVEEAREEIMKRFQIAPDALMLFEQYEHSPDELDYVKFEGGNPRWTPVGTANLELFLESKLKDSV